MLKLNIQNSEIYFKDIHFEQLPTILEWYNRVDEFKYATGIDKPITLEDLIRRYAEVSISSSEFFSAIYLRSQGRMIGILKGRIRFKNKLAVWISSIVIEPLFQNKGYGIKSIELLLGYLKANLNVHGAFLSVISENKKGRNFWDKLGFNEVRKMNNYSHLEGKSQDVFILYKSN